MFHLNYAILQNIQSLKQIEKVKNNKDCCQLRSAKKVLVSCSGAGLRCACGAIAAAVPFFWSFFWACKKTDNEYLVESLVYYLSHFCLEIKGEAKIIRIPAVVFLALMRALPFKKIQCPCGLNSRNSRKHRNY